jgi:hypothetical protein
MRPARSRANAVASGLPSGCRAWAAFQHFSITCRRSSTKVTPPRLATTRRCRAPSPSVAMAQVWAPVGIAPVHLGSHIRDEVVFSGREAGPGPLVGGFGVTLARRAGLVCAEQAVEDLFGGAYPGRMGEPRGDRGHLLLVGLVGLVSPRDLGCAVGFDHGMPLQSMAPTRISPSPRAGAASERRW